MFNVLLSKMSLFTDQPDSIGIKPNHSSLETNASTTFGPISCEADCNPSCSFAWTEDGHSVSDNNTLQLSHIQSTDAGIYTCIAQYDSGYTLTTNVTVHVMCENMFCNNYMYLVN